ncbi:flagellar protein FlaG [Paenibacillus sp. OK076]|uniref:flagellar protein FlaG n=1 Tax=Paenibacillus sp. OK076 TaxID=1884379 RepID=UPI0008B62D32|nr:flagellar protein FlaG [Paenibacillus sp. OK076]SEO66464.1 flagellar protein FlaG [Paenibacillus sp. OK076]
MEPVKSTGTFAQGGLPQVSVSPTVETKDKATSESMAALSPSMRISSDRIEDQEKAIEELNKAIQAIQGPQRFLEFSVHKDTHAIMIKVLNKETGELIREVPPEKILDVAAKMMEFVGLLVDQKA